MKISKLAENLIGSEIIKISNEVNAMQSAGHEIANLTIGDLNSAIYPIPQRYKELIKQNYDAGLTNYPPANGLQSLRKAVSDDLKIRWNLDYNENEVLVAAGSRPLIYAAYLTLVDKGDKVVYPVPSWNNNHYSYLSGAEKIEVETLPENNFLPTADELRPHLSQAVLLALCSPLNPTGTMFTREQLYEICQAVLDENKRRGQDAKPLYLLFDQIYAQLTFDGAEHFNPIQLLPELKPYVIAIDGISKCLAATGVRVGWCFGPKEIVDPMKSLLTHVGAWAPKPEQEATAEFWQDKAGVDDFVDDFRDGLQESLQVLHDGFQNMKNKGLNVDSIEPMGALYLTVKMDFEGARRQDGTFISNAGDLVFYLIEEAGAAFVPFSAFGTDGSVPYFRASVGAVTKEEISAMLPRIEAALHKLS